jgi:glycosyltransferase involved in cell wall biosynthesis
MKKICIDTTYTLSNKTGIGAYIQQLIESLLEYNTEFQFNLFYNVILKHKYIFFNESDKVKNIFFRFPRRWLTKLWESNFMFNDIIFGNPDLFVCTGVHCPKILKSKMVSFIYDLSFLIDDITYSKIEKDDLNKKIKKILDNSEYVAATSISTKNDIIKFYGFPENKIEVIYGSLPKIIFFENDNILKNYGLKKNNYFLCVGTLEKRKNYILICKALRKLKNENIKIVIAGKYGNDYENILNYKEKYNLNNLKLVGYITENEKWNLYRNCQAVLYPSIYEGFGFPVLEAYHFLKPIITTDNGSIRELAGDIAEYVGIDDSDKLGELLIEYSSNMKTVKTEKINFQMKKFSWKKSAYQFFDLLKKC